MGDAVSAVWQEPTPLNSHASSATTASCAAVTERLHWLSATEAADGLRKGDFSSRDLIQDTLDWIADSDSITRAWVWIDEAGALAQANEADREIGAGRIRGPLHGVGFGVKDVVTVAGMPMQVGSAIATDFVCRDDAPVVGRLRAAGGICIGKTVTHEFAFGSTSPPTRNPWDGLSVPGGSSGGSAAAVAAGQVPLAGRNRCCCSVRNPAALTGICGIRPTFGRVSADGVRAASFGLDTVGPLCRTVLDTAVALGVMSAHDPADPRSSAAPVPHFAAHARRAAADVCAAVAGLRDRAPTNYFLSTWNRTSRRGCARP